MGEHVKGLVVLGSTGSIGRQTLEVVRALPGRFRVVGLAAGNNLSLLEEQVREFRPRLVYASRDGEQLYLRLRELGLPCRWALPEEMAVAEDVHLVMVATVGRAGLSPTLAALRAGKVVALANKEVLVMAGHLVREAARQGGGQLRPVDSEHSAIWQCLWGEQPQAVARLFLTASGGPFRDTPLEELARVTAAEALRHPTWQMGPKVTVDSATLLNKGLECIEARWFFDLPLERIEVVLHRESIVHSLVEFRDGSLKAQLSAPDMRLPIQLALTYPERVEGASVPRVDLARLGALHFGPVDLRRYPCLGLALEAGRRGGTYPAALSAADEVAVQHFLAGHIGFLDIPRLLEDVLAAHRSAADPSLDQVLEADAWARAQADEWVRARTR
ncbi:MAG TPA: 1-deoxy-D-xylulose-5-phosphate reductoisomerase [Dehalococcoidia bacterium]|nr:1-deoxy-D-xylulose-5-phosphate reductoisomerase [Dehalococcoidia bacterium]